MRYLDHAATTMMRPEAREAMAPYLDEVYGNPSGVHAVSRRAKNAIEEARERAADLLGVARPLDVVFTGGGTESDNLAIAGAALARSGPLADRRGVVTSAIEHEAVLETARFVARLGCPLTVVTVDGDGIVDPDRVTETVGGDTAVVSVMAANNETGVLQPVSRIADAVRDADPEVPVHTDAVQAFASEEITVTATGADMISLAAHKIGGPKGVGLLTVPEGLHLEPVVHGGGQELGRRSGTHHVAGIVGMVAAMEAAVADRHPFRHRVGSARDRFVTELRHRVPGLEVTAGDVRRLPQHAHLRFPGIPAETLLIRLDGAGIAAAAGSACQSGAVEPSHVLTAMGMDPVAVSECVRFTFGWPDDPAVGAEVAAAVAGVVEDLGHRRAS